MILTDELLRPLCAKGLVGPYLSQLITPVGLISRVGNTIYVENKLKNKIDVAIDISKAIVSKPYLLPAGESILVETFGFYRIPTALTCRAIFLEERVQEGYSGSTMWLNPGYMGRITYRVSNVLKLNALPIYPTLHLTQLIFEEVYLGEERTRGRLPN